MHCTAVRHYSDKIAIIKKGNILTCKSVKEITENTTLEQFYMDITNGKIDKDDNVETPKNEEEGAKKCTN